MSDDLVKRLRFEAAHDLEWGANPAEVLSRAADRIEELEAKLARAVKIAEKSIGWLRLYGADVHKEAATLAELKGQDDE